MTQQQRQEALKRRVEQLYTKNKIINYTKKDLVNRKKCEIIMLYLILCNSYKRLRNNYVDAVAEIRVNERREYLKHKKEMTKK